MLPQNQNELNAIRKECYSMVTKRSSLAGATSAIPVPALDVGADVGILLDLINSINHKFGLTPEQIEKLNPKVKQTAYIAISNYGGQLIGKAVTKQATMQILRKIGVRVATKNITKYIPFVGTAISVAIGFTAMKLVGNSHVDDCYKIAQQTLAAN